MNISLNTNWAAFKAHLLRTVGADEAGNWLRYAAQVMDLEARRKRQVLDMPTRETRQ